MAICMSTGAPVILHRSLAPSYCTAAVAADCLLARPAVFFAVMYVCLFVACCAQVACFCGTSMASEQLQAGLLPLGSSKAESELLLQQTAEAIKALLQVSGMSPTFLHIYVCSLASTAVSAASVCRFKL